jgi:hypothetical protein
VDDRDKPGGDEEKNSSLPGLTRQSMLTIGMKSYWVYILASRPRGPCGDCACC